MVTVTTYHKQDNLQCDVVSLPCLESTEINLQLDCSLYACLQWRYVVVVVVMILMIYELLRIKYHHQSNLGLQKNPSIYLVSDMWRAILTSAQWWWEEVADWLLYSRTLCTLPQSDFDRHSVQIPQCRESLKVALVGGKKTNL